MSENKTIKPIVHFIGKADIYQWPYSEESCEVALVYALDHPIWGKQEVRTSTIIKKNDDGGFETLNTIYKPAENIDV